MVPQYSGSSDTGDLLSACLCTAVIYEALMAVVSIYPDDALLSVASKCIGRFLLSKAANLQYTGNCFSGLFSSAYTIFFKNDARMHVTETDVS